MNKRPLLSAFGILLAAALLGFGWLAWRAHRNLVTLNVRNMDVRKVARKIEWQTWEKILVHKDVQGQVTLRVRKMPLEQVLRLVAEQTTSRSGVLYPLYSSGKSLSALTLALRGEGNAAENGWTNLVARNGFPGGRWGGPGGPGGPGGFFGAPEGNNSSPRLSLEIQGKDVPFVVIAFDRYAQARVVPEDGTAALINLSLREAPVPNAVAQLAKKARRQWTTLYTLQGWGPGPGRGGRGGPEFAMAGRGPGGPAPADGPAATTTAPQRNPGDRERRGFGGPELSEEQREEMRRQRNTLEEELKQVLPPEERQRLEVAQAEREKQMQEWQSLTPEQRRQRFEQQAGGSGIDTRNRQRLLNSTPEQRARMMGPGGPGGPGRGGPGGPPPR